MTEADGIRMGTPVGRWIIAATVLGSGLAMIDGTVVNVALQEIGADLHTGFTGLQWTVNAYTLTLASLILLGGSLGDHFGRRKVFLVGVVWFALASLLCGLAPTIETLVAARALQGVGGALLTPGSLALISASFHGTDRAAAVGVWSGLGGIAGAVGPFLGGWLVEWSWRAVFLINLPIAAVVVLITLRHVPESRDPQAEAGLDVTGTVVATLGLGALTFGLTELGAAGPTPAGLAGTAAGVLALGAFVVVERRSPHPLVSPVLFRDRTFSAVNAVTLLIYGALGVVMLLLVLQLQAVGGYSPLAAGTSLLPVTVIMVLFSARSGALAGRIGPRTPMIVGSLVCAGGVALMLRVGPQASWWTDVLPAVVVFGAGLALTVAPLTATVLDSAPDRFAGAASGTNNAIARAAGLLAVAVVPGIAGLSTSGEGSSTAPDSTAFDAAAFDRGFMTAMLISAGLLVAAALTTAVFLRPSRRADATMAIEMCTHCGTSAPQLHPGSGRAE